MRWLKSLVIVLAALIVLALAMLGYGFYKRTSDPDWRLFSVTKPPATPAAATTPAPADPPSPKAAPWGTINLGIGASCRITGLQTDGPRLYLTIGPDGSCHRIVIIDTEQGRVLGTVQPGP